MKNLCGETRHAEAPLPAADAAEVASVNNNYERDAADQRR